MKRAGGENDAEGESPDGGGSHEWEDFLAECYEIDKAQHGGKRHAPQKETFADFIGLFVVSPDEPDKESSDRNSAGQHVQPADNIIAQFRIQYKAILSGGI